jgi:hypothetical protein
MAILINLLRGTRTCTRCCIPKPLDHFLKIIYYPSGNPGLTADCRSCRNELSTAWRERNPERWRQLWKSYEAKKQPIREERKRVREESERARKTIMAPIYAARRKEKASIREKTDPKVIAYRKAYKRRPDRIQRHKEWNKDPRKVFQRNKRNRARRTNDPQFRLSGRMSCAIYSALRSKKAGRSWETLVGYTLNDLIAHFESLFVDGMGWHNIGLWEIDHVIPRSAFTYTSPEDSAFKDCWGLANLQPLWKSDNRSKKNRIGWNGRLFPKLSKKAARRAEKQALERQAHPVTPTQEEAWLF